MVNQNQNQNEIEEKEIVYAEITEGDYNDVYSSGTFVKGTWSQIEEYVNSYFTKEGLERAEDIGSDGYGLAIWYEQTDEDEDSTVEIEYYVTADPTDDKEIIEAFNNPDKAEELANSWVYGPFIDLGERVKA